MAGKACSKSEGPFKGKSFHSILPFKRVFTLICTLCECYFFRKECMRTKKGALFWWKVCLAVRIRTTFTWGFTFGGKNYGDFMVDWKFIDLIPYQKVPKASYTQVLYWFLNSCIFHHNGLHEHDAISPLKNFGGVSLIDFSTHAWVILFGSNAWASGMIKDYIYVGNIWQKAWDNCVGTYVRSIWLKACCYFCF